MSIFTEQDVIELFGDDLELPKKVAKLLNDGDFTEIGRLISTKLLEREEQLATFHLTQSDPFS